MAADRAQRVSTLGKDGKPLPRYDRALSVQFGNCRWYSDSLFCLIPAKFCCLARVVNPQGRQHEFADMRAAYDALDDETELR